MDATVYEDKSAAIVELEASRQDDVASRTSEDESWSQASSSDDESQASRSSRQSPSRKNVTDHQGFPYISTDLPRHQRRRIQREGRRKKKLGN